MAIYDFLAPHCNHGGVGLSEGGEVLPDDEPVQDDKITWGYGSMDGVHGHHFGVSQDRDMAMSVAQAIRRTADSRKPDKNAQQLYDLLTSRPALDYVDPLLEILRHEIPVDRFDLNDRASVSPADPRTANRSRSVSPCSDWRESPTAVT